MLFVRQIWALARKDLLIFQRRWFSTIIRALIIPVVYTIILCCIRYWTATPGYYGLGDPQPIRSLSNAFASTGSTRPKFVVIDNGIEAPDVETVITGLEKVARESGKEYHRLSEADRIISLCKASSRGVTDCFAAVSFEDSPGHNASGVWSYTILTDASLGGSIDVRITTNDAQIYTLPLQKEVIRLIDSTRNEGPHVPDKMLQYPFTRLDEASKEASDRRTYQRIIIVALSFGFFIGISSSIYHCIGHIVLQREEGMLQLIDAMMPNKSQWYCIVIRMLASHLSFDILYFPGWIIIGGLLKIALPNTDVGLLIGFVLLTGLALTSYSILVSSLFRRAQISAISGMIAAVCFAIVANYGIGTGDRRFPEKTQMSAMATAVLFPPSTYVYFLMQLAAVELDGESLDLSYTTEYINWHIPGSTLLGLLAFQLALFPILAVVIERFLHSTSASARTLSYGDDMAVRLRDFTKIYKSRKASLVAVNKLTVDLHSGSVTVLLGANGSGKSTTLRAIAGLQQFSEGSIEINGTIGICPQENVFWGDLTVEEHISLFDLLKATSSQTRKARQDETNRLIEGCDLGIKRHARAQTLSGGQKRKLQLAMMFAGGSSICCIDEATSGIDPLARRKIWDILLAERGKRTLLMTTHFLDEAEVLSDNVVILSKGALKAEGSVATLKAEMGGGFRIILGENSKEVVVPKMNDAKRYADDTRAIFEVSDSAHLASAIKSLEDVSQQYTVHGPTIENIFLKLSDEMRDDTETAREFGLSNFADKLSLQTGQGSRPLQQISIMFRKRLTILKHNYMPYIAVLFVPLTLAGLVTRFFNDYTYTSGIPCSEHVETIDVEGSKLDLINLGWHDFTYGPPNTISVQDVLNFFPESRRSSMYYNESEMEQRLNDAVTTSASFKEMNELLLNDGGYSSLGGFWGDDPLVPRLAWPSESTAGTLHLQSLVSGILMNTTLDAGYSTFPEAFTPQNFVTSLVALFITLGFSIYPGFFALYPTRERLQKVRAMQYSNGILGSSLWIAYSLFDALFVILISIVAPIIWSTQWHGWYHIEYLAVILFLYGLTSTALAYVVSLFAASQLAAFSATAIVQLVIGMLYFAGYIISAARASSTELYIWFNYIHYTVALVSPVASLMRALLVTFNNYGLVCRGRDLSTNPGEMGLYGAPILYLIVQFVVLVMFLMFWESGRSLEVFGIRLNRRKHGDAERSGHNETHATAKDIDVSDGLQIDHLSKSFRSLRAVDDVSFHVKPSQKYALLGPNGAGKSTIISLIRGDLQPDTRASAIHIGKDSLQHAPVAAKDHLGVCPQFDATDTMTLREHLMFYARARGVADPKHNVDQLIMRLGLEPHQKKLAKKLSGGTHRKLSLAIALIANPLVLLLDEPSSGMDPAAKRALWSTLRETAEGRVLLLTTHSMEEAAALCDRAGILASQLLVQGSTEELCRTYGPEACVLLVHRSAPYASQDEIKTMKTWVRQKFPKAEIEDREFGGQVRFNIPRGTQCKMGNLFQEIEAAREMLGVADYSIGPATLDQVFLDVVLAHGVEEENTSAAQSRWKWPW